MAEFQEIVREFHRMCETQRKLHNTCNKCPVKIATMGTMFQCYRYVTEKPKEAENIIMAWAIENPEPVYPTWGEYLMSQIMPYGTGDWSTLLLEHHIPADIAQKLGIEPKEDA